MKYVGLNKITYALENKPFGKGGEGEVYKISGRSDIIAKIYAPSKASNELEQKLKIMLINKPDSLDELSWVTDILYTPSGKFVGYTMPYVASKKNLRELSVPENRGKYTWDFFVRIARNLSAVVNNIHEKDYVIGDFNPENILVDEKERHVTIIDTDSFQVRDPKTHSLLRCGVGKRESIAPEMLGKDFKTVPEKDSFNKNTDNYSLALHIFFLLIGAHPFSCTELSDDGLYTQYKNIINGVCVYFKETYPSDAQIGIPLYSSGIGWLPDEIQDLFHRAFVLGFKEPSKRPTPEEWYYTLKALEKSFKRCSANNNHVYPRTSSYCPWCETKVRYETRKKTVSRIASQQIKSKTNNRSSPLNQKDNPYDYWSKFLKNQQQNKPNLYTQTQTGTTYAVQAKLYYCSNHRKTLFAENLDVQKKQDELKREEQKRRQEEEEQKRRQEEEEQKRRQEEEEQKRRQEVEEQKRRQEEEERKRRQEEEEQERRQEEEEEEQQKRRDERKRLEEEWKKNLEEKLKIIRENKKENETHSPSRYDYQIDEEEEIQEETSPRFDWKGKYIPPDFTNKSDDSASNEEEQKENDEEKRLEELRKQEELRKEEGKKKLEELAKTEKEERRKRKEEEQKQKEEERKKHEEEEQKRKEEERRKREEEQKQKEEERKREREDKKEEKKKKKAAHAKSENAKYNKILLGLVIGVIVISICIAGGIYLNSLNQKNSYAQQEPAAETYIPVPSSILTIDSNPSNAAIYINDELYGTTPASLTITGYMSLKIKLTKEGYYDYSDSLEITPEKSGYQIFGVLEKKNVGNLRITGFPGYIVYLDGELLGTLVKDTETFEGINAGPHTLRVEYDGRDATSQIMIETDKTYSTSFALAKK